MRLSKLKEKAKELEGRKKSEARRIGFRNMRKSLITLTDKVFAELFSKSDISPLNFFH